MWGQSTWTLTRASAARAAPQGLPFAVVGVGDLLALFRCVSVRYRFSTDITRPALMGAIGRVFSTMEVRRARPTASALASLSCSVWDSRRPTFTHVTQVRCPSALLCSPR